ncbi:retrovirus-related pol polyprotein from transposon TNT 1-94 [Tanacetum coccineum]
MHADLKYVESLEKEVDELESDKAEFSNMYDMLLQECVSNDVMYSYFHSLSDLDAHTELQCLYLHKVKECECLAQKLSKQTEFVSKEVYTELLRSFAKLGKHLISLEPTLQQCQEQMQNDTVCKEKASNACIELTLGQHKLEHLQLPQTYKNTNPRMSTSTGVTHRTSVSRPTHRSTQIKDKVVPNTSQVKFKKTEVEDHHRISSISNKTKSVTTCNDSLKSRTSNVNVVCATCGKCVFNSNHDACVYKFLNNMNARSKKPNVVPISTRKPKSQANKYVATHPKKTVASESTIQNSKSYYRMLYEKTITKYDYVSDLCGSNIFPRLDELAVATKSRSLFDVMMLYFERETTNDLEFAADLHNLWVQFIDRTNDRKLFISELEGVPSSLMSYNYCEFLHQVQQDDSIKLLTLSEMIAETYREVHKKIDFVYVMKNM